MNKYIKFAIINIIVFGLFCFLFSLLVPSAIRFNKTNQAKGNLADVKAKLLDTAQWKNWHAFYETKKFRIINLQSPTDSTITYELVSDAHKQKNEYILVQVGNTVVINWQLQEEFGYMPWNKLRAVGAEKQLKDVVENSLQRFVSLP